VATILQRSDPFSTMHVTPELIVTAVLAIAVAIVGILTIGVIHWRTQVLLKYRGKDFPLRRDHSCCLNIPCSPRTAQDLELQPVRPSTPIPRRSTESSDMLISEPVNLNSYFDSELFSAAPQFQQQIPHQSAANTPCLTCGDASPPYSIEDVLSRPFGP
jgi:hypothetical protein